MTGPPLIHVIILARYPTIRAGLRSVLESDPGFSVVAETDAPASLPALLDDPGADLLLVDLVDDPPDSRERIRELAADRLLPPLVLLFGSATDALAALGVSNASLLLRDASPDEIHSAARSTLAGLVAMDQRIVGEIGEQYAWEEPPAEPVPEAGASLTPRELDVLQRIARGLPNKTIAIELGISEHTVKFHVGSIFEKLEVGSRSEAVAVAARRGLFLL